MATAGTPVNIMSRVDANNNNAPGTAANGTNAEYTPRCHRIVFQGYKPGSSNNGMVVNSGLVYILRSLGPSNQNSGGPQNRTDSGAMIYVLGAGNSLTIECDQIDRATMSPYRYSLDSDNNNDGALVTLYGCTR